MLSYVETMEKELKQALTESFKSKKQKKKGGDSSGEGSGNDEEDDLAQITGGKEAEVEQYTDMLAKITEQQLIQDGLLGRFFPLI